MLRFIFMCIRSIPYMPFALMKCVHMEKHPEKYSDMDKYRHIQKIVNYLRKNSNTKTVVYGEENLPKEGSYVIFSNHQGKYDGLSIECYHPRPLAIIMDKNKADMIVAKQMMPLVKGRGIDLNDPHQQMRVIKDVTEDLKSGLLYLIFPEGGYDNNKNTMREFKTGVFKCAYDAKVPIVPVTLIDSYKAMEGNSLKKVTTQVHYLKPIPYEEYKDLKRSQCAELVKARIQECLDAYAPKEE